MKCRKLLLALVLSLTNVCAQTNQPGNELDRLDEKLGAFREVFEKSMDYKKAIIDHITANTNLIKALTEIRLTKTNDLKALAEIDAEVQRIMDDVAKKSDELKALNKELNDIFKSIQCITRKNI